MPLPRKKRKAKDSFYVDNEQLVKEVLEYQEKLRHAKENGLPKPQMTDSLGSMFFMIADRLSTYRSFASYQTYREDMVAIGVENCIRYVHNFNTEKTTNAFAYFTQVAYHAFIGLLGKEKKYRETKQKFAESLGMSMFPTSVDEDEPELISSSSSIDEHMRGDNE